MTDLYVASPEALHDLVERLRGAEWLAVDTEFMRESTYRAQLCLVQVADASTVACIDTIALDDLGPLMDLLSDPATVKVLHAARQDLEIFHDLTGRVPGPVFDTQIAATLAGQGDQVGYGDLVNRLLGHRLDKSQARTDWSARPLSAEQLAYAADDVRHLGTVYLKLRERLAAAGRIEWLDEDFAQLLDPQNYRNDPDEAWHKVRGTRQLSGPQMAVLRTLAAWRERQAASADRPRRWILDDAALVALARGRPTRREQLQRLRGLNDGVVRRHGNDLLELIRSAADTPPPAPSSRPRRLESGEDATVDALLALLRLLATRHGVSQATLATRRDIEALVRGEREIPLLEGWRHGLAGEALLNYLSGEGALVVREGKLILESGTDR